MYYAVRMNDESLQHSKGVWKIHKYLRKVGNKYYYYDNSKTNKSSGIRTYSHVRTEDEYSGDNAKNVKEVDYLQEVNSNDWFSSFRENKSHPFYSVNSKGETVANYYNLYKVGKIERFARDNQQKVENFIDSLLGKKEKSKAS